MSAEALEFAKNAISVGAQPTRLRVLLSKKFGTHLISKDIINLKQSLTGNVNSIKTSYFKIRFTDILDQEMTKANGRIRSTF